jgi:hypothetical protein
MIINYVRFLTKGDISQNILLSPGDVVFVPETNSVDWNTVFQGLIGSYYAINSANQIKQ